jgi:hypothetical protein
MQWVLYYFFVLSNVINLVLYVQKQNKSYQPVTRTTADKYEESRFETIILGKLTFVSCVLALVLRTPSACSCENFSKKRACRRAKFGCWKFVRFVRLQHRMSITSCSFLSFSHLQGSIPQGSTLYCLIDLTSAYLCNTCGLSYVLLSTVLSRPGV